MADVRGWVAGAVALMTICLTAFLGGGYFPETWGWSALGALVLLAAALLVLDKVELGAWDAALLGALAAFVLWTALSIAWSRSVPRSVWEVERGLVYVACLAAVLVLARKRDIAQLLGGILVATVAVCAFALATRLFPDLLGLEPAPEYRLSRPLGYWNAVGIAAAMGALLAAGFAAEARSRIVRVLAAAATVVLVPTVYFTFGRGAWIALGLGLVAAALASGRSGRFAVRTAVLAVPIAAAVWAASRFDGLTTPGTPVAAAAHDGRRLALVLLACLAAAALVPLLLERVPPPTPSRTRLSVAFFATLAVAGVVAAVIRAGGPVTLVERASDSFTEGGVSGSRTSDRLLTLSGSGRAEYWSVAWRQYREAPALGTGAGTFDLYWNRDRPNSFGALDAHNLYLETLAEVGPVGLVLLLAALGLPLAALPRVRGRPLAAAAAGPYVAFLVHAALDWDWEIPTVTTTALLCGAALVVAARSGRERELGATSRAGGLAAVAALTVLLLVAQAGNSALVRSEEARDDGDLERSEAEARTAMRWAPWSSRARLALASAQAGRGDARAAAEGLREAVERDPHDWRTWYELGVATSGGERERALDRAAELNPRNPGLVP